MDTLQLICPQSEGNIQLRDYDGMGRYSDTVHLMIVKKVSVRSGEGLLVLCIYHQRSLTTPTSVLHIHF